MNYYRVHLFCRAYSKNQPAERLYKQKDGTHDKKQNFLTFVFAASRNFNAQEQSVYKHKTVVEYAYKTKKIHVSIHPFPQKVISYNPFGAEGIKAVIRAGYAPEMYAARLRKISPSETYLLCKSGGCA